MTHKFLAHLNSVPIFHLSFIFFLFFFFTIYFFFLAKKDIWFLPIFQGVLCSQELWTNPNDIFHWKSSFKYKLSFHKINIFQIQIYPTKIAHVTYTIQKIWTQLGMSILDDNTYSHKHDYGSVINSSMRCLNCILSTPDKYIISIKLFRKNIMIIKFIKNIDKLLRWCVTWLVN